MTIDTRRLSLAERRYVLTRLVADGAADQEYAETIMRADHWDIPIVIADRDVLALYESVDRRTAELLSVAPARITIAAGSPLVQAMDLPDELKATGTIPAPTWRRANRGEILLWFSLGLGAGVMLAIASSMLGFALTTGAFA